MKILGLTSCLSWNIAACTVINGKLIDFVEEERFNQVKHSPRKFPKNAIDYCLKNSNLTIDDFDFIAIGFDSPIKASLKNFIRNLSEGNFIRAIQELGAYAEYFVENQRMKAYLNKISKNGNIQKKLVYMNHHLTHAASAARCSGFNECIILTLDGVGEDESGSVSVYSNGNIKKLKSIGMNQSLGALYTDFTALCGFKSHSHEGKTMGLAPFGSLIEGLQEKLIKFHHKGYTLKKNWNKTLIKSFKSRRPDEDLSDIHKNLAFTAQDSLEKCALSIVNYYSKKLNIKNIALAGGVALNCDMNTKILFSKNIDEVFVQPASNDAGCALGAALELYYQKTNIDPNFRLKNSYYGPSYSQKEVIDFLVESKISYRKSSLDALAKLLSNGSLVGWFNGKMEFGPRSLGGRSILAHPSIKGIKDKVNNEVKHRETWRPFAPSVLYEHQHEYFKHSYFSPFMLMTFESKQEKLETIQEVIHVDNTSRIQSVRKEDSPEFYELIYKFYELTGIPMLLNTSFNDAEKPICLSPRQAVQTFYSTGLDYLYIEGLLLSKKTN